eukprot:TRINITY_DN355_c0_g2_i1.p1 TRINITY_DN355_c0_g2~~TRINITY_DN355_c0_g2_i1.p1  ORF type:complete len:297 (+),score=74.20 TRINITY_DN355_c0_g2_i1:2-892(+)
MSWGAWGWDVLQNTVSAVSDTTNIILNDLAEAIDTGEGEVTTTETDGTQDAKTAGTEAQKAENTGETTEQVQGEEVKSEVSAPTTGFVYRSPILGALTAGANLLGSALQKGVDVVQATDVNLSYETLMGVGEGIATSTLGAFEMVGESAFAILTTEVGPSDKPQTKPIFFPELVSGDKTVTQVSKTVMDVFEDLTGKETMTTLEQLSIHSMMESQKAYRQLSFEDREEVDDATTEMEEILEDEEEPTDVPSLAESDTQFQGLLKSFLEEPKDTKLDETLESIKQKSTKHWFLVLIC